MLHAKFQNHRSGSGEEDFLRFLPYTCVWAWRPSWSCDLEHFHKLSFPLPKEAPYKALIGRAVLEMFENCGNIHVNSPGGRGRQSPAVIFFSITQLFGLQKLRSIKK